MTDPVERFALYVSSVEGCPITRFGTRTLIGATRSAATPTVVQYDTDKIVAISSDEYRRYLREYERAIVNGTLKRRKPEDWDRQQARRRAAEQAVAQKTDERNAEQRGEGTPSAPDTPAQE